MTRTPGVRCMARLPLAALLALTGALSAPTAQAVDWSGYFRAGPGLTSNSTNRACYAQNGGTSGMKYRLAARVSLMTNHCTGNPDTALGRLTARVPGQVRERVGDLVHLQWAPESLHLFDARTQRRVA